MKGRYRQIAVVGLAEKEQKSSTCLVKSTVAVCLSAHVCVRVKLLLLEMVLLSLVLLLLVMAAGKPVNYPGPPQSLAVAVVGDCQHNQSQAVLGISWDKPVIGQNHTCIQPTFW